MFSSLCDAKIIKSTNKEIKNLLGFFFARMICYLAPESPNCSSSDLRTVFSLLISQLKDIASIASGSTTGEEHARLLLVNLSACNAFALLCTMPTDSEDSLLVVLFNVLLDSVSAETPSDLIASIVHIFKNCIQELYSEVETIQPASTSKSSSKKKSRVSNEWSSSEHLMSQYILDSLFTRLTPSSKKDNFKSYELAKTIITETANYLQPSISNFINGKITGNVPLYGNDHAVYIS